MINSTPLALSENRAIPLQPAAAVIRANQPLPWYRLIYSDYRRCIASEDSAFRTIVCSQGFWACCFYRTSRAMVQATRPAILRKTLRVAVSVAQKVVEIVTVGISIQIECEIGEGLYIGHHGTTILPAHGALGRNCNLAQNVTIGLAGRGDRRGAPKLGDRVFVGTNAVVVGKIVVGDDAMICAGSVVTRSVPPRAVIVGNPARVVSYDGSFDHVAYDRMEEDPARQESLALRGQPPKGVVPEPPAV